MEVLETSFFNLNWLSFCVGGLKQDLQLKD